MIKPTSFESLINFPEWVRNKIVDKGLTLKQLAKLSGISYSSLLVYVDKRVDKRVEPSLFAVSCICNALGYELGVLRMKKK